MGFNAAVLDLDPEFVAASIKQVDEVLSRTVLRLGSLNASLRRHEVPAPKAQPKPQIKPPAKTAITETKK